MSSVANDFVSRNSSRQSSYIFLDTLFIVLFCIMCIMIVFLRARRIVLQFTIYIYT